MLTGSFVGAHVTFRLVRMVILKFEDLHKDHLVISMDSLVKKETDN